MEKLVIDRNKWLRGERPSVLLRKGDGKMCCLGFYAISRGCSEASIRQVRTPANMEEETYKLSTRLIDGEHNTDLCSALMGHNDATFTEDVDGSVIKLTERERESKIKELFAKMNVEVEFIN